MVMSTGMATVFGQPNGEHSCCKQSASAQFNALSPWKWFHLHANLTTFRRHWYESYSGIISNSVLSLNCQIMTHSFRFSKNMNSFISYSN